MSSQNILQQIKNSHSLLPASRDPPPIPYAIASDTLRDRPWQEIQQTETFAIANQLSQQIKMIYLPITQPTLEVRSLLPEYQTLFSMMVERSIPPIQLLILSNSDRYFCRIQSKCRPNIKFC